MLPIGSIIGVAGKIIDQFVEDKDLKTKINGEIKKQINELDKKQAEINLEQAKHPSLFVAGARPAIMWICALGIFTNFFFMPIAEWIAVMIDPKIKLPDLNTGELMTLTLSLLGLGGLRSYEKSKGVARDNMKK